MTTMESSSTNSIAVELLEMSKVDQEMRFSYQKNNDAWDGSVDHRNTARLKEIVQKSGWPTIPEVGVEASNAAWLLVQHATDDPDFMKHCLHLMKALGEGSISLLNIAFLEDRVLTMEEKPQIYGTQFHDTGFGLELFPVVDPKNVNERRAKVGLESIAEN